MRKRPLCAGFAPTAGFIFDTGGGKSSLLVETGAPPFDGGVAVAVDSTDPFGDFRVSMEEMVDAHGVSTDWTWLQEMLGWFLRANDKGGGDGGGREWLMDDMV
ncbi:transcription repressor OFP18-like [Phalaenopsis equestris]|uniref:transcription repressor OFP18-like n=1 Tax=Phalaenopsis equestris TaxID=78828 RepID=UPI0009E26DFC|nr:transcription repressor OFP18-like [Phalaenopsis equestris]